MLTDLKTRLLAQQEFIESELTRVKTLVNESGFDVTSSIYVITKQYRDELKKQLTLIRFNMAEDND